MFHKTRFKVLLDFENREGVPPCSTICYQVYEYFPKIISIRKLLKAITQDDKLIAT